MLQVVLGHPRVMNLVLFRLPVELSLHSLVAGVLALDLAHHSEHLAVEADRRVVGLNTAQLVLEARVQVQEVVGVTRLLQEVEGDHVAFVEGARDLVGEVVVVRALDGMHSHHGVEVLSNFDTLVLELGANLVLVDPVLVLRPRLTGLVHAKVSRFTDNGVDTEGILEDRREALDTEGEPAESLGVGLSDPVVDPSFEELARVVFLAGGDLHEAEFELDLVDVLLGVNELVNLHGFEGGEVTWLLH
mmetsp:Transcript_11741/g.17980  ORF Transcript_11741/g.17980 Transcript_11741/m.17980 type:complete len:246 (-) Transcript_11741:674-1411(-)